MKRVLFVIDMQKDFIDGALGSAEAVAIVSNVKALIKEAKANNDTVIFTRDTHFDNYMDTYEGKNLPVPHCIIGTPGWEVSSELDTTGHIVIDKITFGYTDWKPFIDNVSDKTGSDVIDTADELILVGLCTDICVISNALILRAFYPDKPITIIENATAGVTPEAKAAALATAKSCQITVA